MEHASLSNRGPAVVVGNGMMARAFFRTAMPEHTIIFASGVSNSLETDRAQFEREQRLLGQTRDKYPEALLVYFGTCSVFDPDRIDTPYVQHKLAMESLLAESGAPYLVIRLPLVIGRSDRAMTLPYILHKRIRSGETLEIWSRATRYPIDIDDVCRIAARLADRSLACNRCVNVALRSYPVIDFVRAMETIVGRKANVRLVDRGGSYELDCPEVKSLARELGLDYSNKYLPRTLRKYFVR